MIEGGPQDLGENSPYINPSPEQTSADTVDVRSIPENVTPEDPKNKELDLSGLSYENQSRVLNMKKWEMSDVEITPCLGRKTDPIGGELYDLAAVFAGTKPAALVGTLGNEQYLAELEDLIAFARANNWTVEKTEDDKAYVIGSAEDVKSIIEADSNHGKYPDEEIEKREREERNPWNERIGRALGYPENALKADTKRMEVERYCMFLMKGNDWGHSISIPDNLSLTPAQIAAIKKGDASELHAITLDAYRQELERLRPPREKAEVSEEQRAVEEEMLNRLSERIAILLEHDSRDYSNAGVRRSDLAASISRQIIEAELLEKGFDFESNESKRIGMMHIAVSDFETLLSAESNKRYNGEVVRDLLVGSLRPTQSTLINNRSAAEVIFFFDQLLHGQTDKFDWALSLIRDKGGNVTATGRQLFLQKYINGINMIKLALDADKAVNSESFVSVDDRGDPVKTDLFPANQLILRQGSKVKTNYSSKEISYDDFFKKLEDYGITKEQDIFIRPDTTEKDTYAKGFDGLRRQLSEGIVETARAKLVAERQADIEKFTTQIAEMRKAREVHSIKQNLNSVTESIKQLEEQARILEAESNKATDAAQAYRGVIPWVRKRLDNEALETKDSLEENAVKLTRRKEDLSELTIKHQDAVKAASNYPYPDSTTLEKRLAALQSLAIETQETS